MNCLKNGTLATHVAKAADGGKKPPQLGMSEGGVKNDRTSYMDTI